MLRERMKVECRMLWLAAVLVGSALIAQATASQATSATGHYHPNTFAVAAYLPDYRIHAYLSQYVSEGDDEDRSVQNANTNGTAAGVPASLTDLILFSLQPHSRGLLGGCCLQQDHYDLVRKFRSRIRHTNSSNDDSLTIWVTLGGGGRTDAFPEICADEKRRKRLIDAVVKLWYGLPS